MLDTSAIEALPLDIQIEKAFNKVLRCASASEQSSLKVQKKLEMQGFCVEAVEAALEKALRLGVIDDARYAECLVRSTLLAGKGLRAVRAEIESLGIDIEGLDSYAEYLEAGEEADIERAYQFLCMHPTRSKNAYQSCVRKLLNKGYEGDVVHRATKRYLAEKGAQELGAE